MRHTMGIIIAVDKKYALVAQLDRVFDYESKGQGFESLRARQKRSIIVRWCFFFRVCKGENPMGVLRPWMLYSAHRCPCAKSPRSSPQGNLLRIPFGRAKKEVTFVYQKLLLFFIQAAGLAYHHRTKSGAYHQPFGLDIITAKPCINLPAA